MGKIATKILKKTLIEWEKKDFVFGRFTKTKKGECCIYFLKKNMEK